MLVRLTKFNFSNIPSLRYNAYYEQYSEFDYFLTVPDYPNPWQSDSTELWDTEKQG